MINYKGYIGVFEFDEKKNLFFGKVVDSASLRFREILLKTQSIKK
jgi:predicted HicB family RNase H-like nuclease